MTHLIWATAQQQPHTPSARCWLQPVYRMYNEVTNQCKASTDGRTRALTSTRAHPALTVNSQEAASPSVSQG